MKMEQAKQKFEEFADELERDDELQEKLKQDPVGTIRTVAAGIPPDPLKTDKWIYRIVVIALGGTVLTGAIGAIILAAAGQTVPEILLALGSAAVGALAGLLAPSPSRES